MNKAPRLRFKGFSEDWESKKLGSLLEFKNGINASKEQYGHGKKFINVLDILNNNYITHENIIGKVDIDESTFEKYSVGYGDVVFQRSSETREEVGTANVYLDKEQKSTFGGFIIRGKKVGEYDPIFMNKLLKSSTSRKEITTKSGGSTRYNVGQETLSDVSLLFPRLEEQEKIASFFSLIDDKISLQREKVDALKDYKTGMMQKIFSRELRFKDDDGRDYPEWKEKKLEEFIDIITDYVAAGSFATIRENVKYKNDKDYAQLIRTVDLKSKFKNSNNFVYVDKNAFEFLYRVNLNKESIILPNVGNIGEVYFVKPENLPNEKNVLAPNSILLRSSKNSNLFLYQLFNTKGFRDSLDVITSKSSQPKFNKTELKEIKLNMPTEQEQIKISKLLDNIDIIIEKEQEKLDSLNEYKKGLLQQMFV